MWQAICIDANKIGIFQFSSILLLFVLLKDSQTENKIEMLKRNEIKIVL